MPITSKRSYYKPFEYPWAYTYFKKMRSLHWVPEEAPLQEDVRDWVQKLNEKEKNLIAQIFRFFTQGDVDVADCYALRYIPAFPMPEFKMLFMAIGDSEANHIDSYSLLIDTLGFGEGEYQAFLEYEDMRAKHDYLFAENTTAPSGRPWNRKERLALDIAKFSAFGEGMQLFASFAILLSFKNRNLMKGMSTIVEWSIRDETLHVEAMTQVFRTLRAENPKLRNPELDEAIYQTGRDMVALEDRFIDLAFAMGGVDGITAEETKAYIRFIADRRFQQLGLLPIYNQTENPFAEWIDWLISAQTHANFFEARSTEYSKGGVVGWDKAFAFLTSDAEAPSP